MLGALMYGVPLVGRQWGMVVSSALMAISLFLFSAINTEASNVGLNIMEYFFQSMFNALDISFALATHLLLTCSQYSVRLDARGIPSADPRYRVRCSQLLGSTIQHRITLDRGSSSGVKCEWPPVLGRGGSFRVHDMHHVHASKVHGRQKLLKRCLEWRRVAICLICRRIYLEALERDSERRRYSLV